MRGPGFAIRVAGLMFFAVCLATFAQAQYRTSIQGVVTDATGAVVPGATLTLTNPATGGKQIRTSDDAGVFNFNALAAARFRLEVEKNGFQKKVIENLELIPEQPNAVNVALEVGAETQTVTVNAETLPLLQTETASVNGVVSDNQIQHMPSFGRDVFQMIQLAPGVFGDGAQGGGGGSENLPGMQGPGASGGSTGIFGTENGPAAVAAGQQYENNSITIDGISTSSAVWGGTTIITPSEDSVDNVKVLSNGYDAENGRFSGAQIQVTSKSGSNHFHGSAFFAAHRPGLSAYQRFNGNGNKPLRDTSFFDQFGGSVSGPIWKNKVFAFFAWETVRSPKAQVNIGNQWAETPDFAALASSNSIASQYLNFPGNGITSQGVNNVTCQDAGLNEGVNCHAVAGGLNLGTPLTAALGSQDLGWTGASSPGTGGNGSGGPENLGTVADIANYVTSSTSNYSKNQYNGRLDADVTAKDRLGFAIYWVPQNTTFNNGARGYDIFHHTQINEAYSAIWNHTFSPSMLNEFRVNGAGWHWNEVASNPQSPVGLPVDNIDTIGSVSVSHFGPNVGSILDQWTYSFKDVATKIVGRHTIKFGGELTRLFYLNNCAGCGVPSYNFFNLWDFLNDAPHNEGGGFNPTSGFPTTLRQDDRTDIWGFFAQDDFKLRRNLTLNLGLRWSYFGPLSSKEGNMFVATPGAGSDYLTGLTVHKGNSWNAQKNNFGPQLGFAWSPEPFHDKLVIRGGYGLNYNQEEIAISANVGNNPGLVVFPSLTMSTPTSANPGIVYAVSSGIHDLTGYPQNLATKSCFDSHGLPTACPGGTQPSPVGVSIFPNTLPTMRVHHYSLDVQYDLGHKFVASLGYQGSLSRNIYFHQNPNATPATLSYTLNPQIGGGDYWSVLGHGNYNALLAEVKHDFAHQFMADAQFTWAKSLDTGSSPYSSGFPPFNEPFFPYNPDINYGRSDYNVGKAFKLFGMWQPVFFHGNKKWIEKIAGGWSLSGIFNIHSGFPWTPFVNVVGGSLYCGTCGYGNLPATYLGAAGTSTSNDQFKTGSNYANGSLAYFGFPSYTAYSSTNFGNALPQIGLQRNSFNGPGYKAVDITVAKGFGLPALPGLGENAKFEFRMDIYNLFNNLNFNPTSISANIGCQTGPNCTPIDPTAPGISNSNFGQATSALGARVITLGARFSF
ncbi:MAG: TonB-dependent receptor [Acidobacteriia bacterium]|nr:TonB-dependent receptor [Terriglobia bacterium]